MERDVHSFLGKLNYISRFISNLIAKAEPIFKLLKKNNTAKWDQTCQEAFEKIKQYLSNPLILVPSMMGRPINYHEAVDFKFLDEYINVVGDDTEGPDDVWEMYFDGAVNLASNGIGAVLVAPDGKYFPIAVKLRFGCTNNIAEYKACYKIRHLNSSPHRPQMNGAIEAVNKNLKRIIGKMIVTYKDWHDVFLFALHAYQTMVRTSTGATPYSLVYWMEAILPIEVEIPSLRVLKEVKLDEKEWVQSRLDQLNLMDEKRLTAVCHGQLYQRRMARAFDKSIRPRKFQ
ncbi:uncharacterized protein LOC131170260 [Hevea brasiliensis]|uniref:uncharacterized protein LOC131170260 n=1 Tax=Hevea brasiliensis TaxID=3981 RepID=UPI0025DCF963|nr:uncharacterized protein LOC131170260 [Hevea brasiliensis]